MLRLFFNCKNIVNNKPIELVPFNLEIASHLTISVVDVYDDLSVLHNGYHGRLYTLTQPLLIDLEEW